MSELRINRRQALAAGLAGATIASVPATAKTLAGAPGGQAAAERLLGQVAEDFMALSPETATSLNIDKGPRAGAKFRLGDRSEAGQQRFAAMVRRDLARAEALDLSGVDHSTRTSVEVVKSAYRTALRGYALPYGDVAVGGYRNSPYVVSQNTGAYLDTPSFLDTDHLVENRTDAEAYLARLAQFPAQLDGELGRVRAAAAKGLVPPDFIIDKALKQLAIAAKDAHDGGDIVTSLTKRTTKIPGRWGEQATRIARAQVAPALDRQIAELTRLRPRAKSDAGVWAQPAGAAYYDYALRASTTTSLRPDEIHRRGLAELDELHGRMDVILKTLGYSKGSVGERMRALAKDPRYKFSDGDKGRAEIVAFIVERLKLIRAVLPRAFNTLVTGNLEIKRIPVAQEQGAPGAFGGPGSPDGKIPGKFWINLRTPDLHSKYSLPDLAAHEAIPGHVWQGEYTFSLPRIRTILAFNAYSEGWALYAEQLVDELGVYDNDPVGRLGYLQSIAFRACRLVVDTGIHSQRWTREQGVQFFVERNGSNPLEVASEVDRYCSWPGQACGYKIGQDRILELRARAQRELGAKYDLKAYDDAVVKGGNVPLDVLALNIDDYIARTKRT